MVPWAPHTVGPTCGTHVVGSYGAYGGAHMWDPCQRVPHMGSNALELFLVIGSADPTTRNNSRTFDLIHGTCRHGSHMWAHHGSVGPDNMGPTSGPTVCGSTESIICGAYYSFPKKTLNSDKINLHPTYAAPYKILRTSVKSICTSRTTNPQKAPQDFCKTNPLNVYR